ncbi:MAG: [FeFe] hydrogenase H-cluster maturation GTPase HydF [Deltaproteobacteria bacterium]|nr:[FeFe] hydrogenase H-cluster maturation GTPase HydF [Deltaproteobacteria bacterium]
MQKTPRGLRVHIGIFGRRNVGKSSLLNAVTRQDVAIVSPQAGTTTDPVEKPMEMLPLGPVLFIDTAGIDDEGALGALRVRRTRQVFDRTDLGILVTEAGSWGVFEDRILGELQARGIPVVVVMNKIDVETPSTDAFHSLSLRGVRVVCTSTLSGEGIFSLRQALLDSIPASFLDTPSIAADLVGPGGMAVLVVPIDKEAPKGRLILPQVQTIRDLLDHDCFSLVVKERELRLALERLKSPPALVITDSQVFLKVAADVPPPIPMTSFSILFSRFKGDLLTQVEGALAIDSLKEGDRILIAEACSHHPIADDIGRVKIPRWLTQYVGVKLQFQHIQGHDFPEDLDAYGLVIHCGACMINRREMLSRILQCRRVGVPVTNYGVVIAYSLGILERALEPFPSARDLYRQARLARGAPGGLP